MASFGYFVVSVDRAYCRCISVWAYVLSF